MEISTVQCRRVRGSGTVATDLFSRRRMAAKDPLGGYKEPRFYRIHVLRLVDPEKSSYECYKRARGNGGM